MTVGDQAKVIEGTAETATLPVPDSDDKPKRPNKIMDAADTALGPKERKPRGCLRAALDRTISAVRLSRK